MALLYLLLLLISVILLALATLGVPGAARFNLLAGGLFFFVLVFAIKAAMGFSGG